MGFVIDIKMVYLGIGLIAGLIGFALFNHFSSRNSDMKSAKTSALVNSKAKLDPRRIPTLGVGTLAVSLLLVTFLGYKVIASQSNYQPPLAMGVLMGFVLLICTMTGLVLVFRALKLTDRTAALGLPSGSIRALLALALVILFVGVCSTILATPAATTGPALDMAKQILAVSATALTTVIGFYFGSNSSTDAYKNAQLQALGSDTGGLNDGGTNAATPVTLDDLTQQTASMKAIVDALAARLTQNNMPSADAIAHDHPDAAGLDKLRDLAAQCSARITAATVDRDRAAKALQDIQNTNADAPALQNTSEQIKRLAESCNAEQAAFNAALAALITQRDAILKSVAQG